MTNEDFTQQVQITQITITEAVDANPELGQVDKTVAAVATNLGAAILHRFNDGVTALESISGTLHKLLSTYCGRG